MIVRVLLIGIIGVIGLCGAPPGAVAGQAVPYAEPGGEAGHTFSLEAGVVSATLLYARHRADGSSIGLGLGGGAGLGMMAVTDDFTQGGSGRDRTFAELLHADLFYRTASSGTQLEAGVRGSWLYHFPTETGTVFGGLQGTLLLPVGRVQLGPRLMVGYLRGEGGQSSFNVGLVPLTGRITWR